MKNIRIGASIAAHPQSGEFIGALRLSDPRPALKAAIADICEIQDHPAHAHECLGLFKKYLLHNARASRCQYQIMHLAAARRMLLKR